jgi:hypothetical protein
VAADETYLCIRDPMAAKPFLRLALSGAGGVRLRVINVGGRPAYARAIAELRDSGEFSRRQDNGAAARPVCFSRDTLSLATVALLKQHHRAELSLH